MRIREEFLKQGEGEHFHLKYGHHKSPTYKCENQKISHMMQGSLRCRGPEGRTQMKGEEEKRDILLNAIEKGRANGSSRFKLHAAKYTNKQKKAKTGLI